MSAKEKLQSLLNASDEQMGKLLKNNPPEHIIERVITLCEVIQSQKHDAVFDVTPDYVKISVPPGKRGTKVVELLPLREEVVVNVMKLPVNVEFQKGRRQDFSDGKLNWYRLDFKEETDFETMLGAILDVYEQKLHK